MSCVFDTSYSKSIDNCSKVINLVDRAYIYDNSIDGKDPELLFRTVKNNGKHGMRFYKGHNSWAWGSCAIISGLIYVALSVQECVNKRSVIVVLPDPLGPATTINTGEEMHHNCIKNQQNFIFKEERIKIRTLKGGHTVPAEKIKSRYSKSIDNCSTKELVVPKSMPIANLC
jgi:hypothetical protein